MLMILRYTSYVFIALSSPVRQCEREFLERKADEMGDDTENIEEEATVADIETESVGSIELDNTIRSRLRSASKLSCRNKSKRYRRNSKGTRQNQTQERTKLNICNDLKCPFNGSTPLKGFKSSKRKCITAKNTNKIKHCSKTAKQNVDGKFRCSCKENNWEISSSSKGCDSEEKSFDCHSLQPLSKILNDDGSFTILSNDKPVTVFPISCNGGNCGKRTNRKRNTRSSDKVGR